MPEKHSVLQMVGEFLRELSILVFVFVPLELWHPNISQQIFTRIIVWTFALAITSLMAGIIIERVRP